MNEPWQRCERDEEIDGWKIELSGHPGAFFVKDSQLHTMGKTLDEYIVIQPVSDETETRAGLILPASALSTVAVRTGIVTAVGRDIREWRVGDRVGVLPSSFDVVTEAFAATA